MQSQADVTRNSNEIKVFISHRDSKCYECGEELGRQAWITLEEYKGALCLPCADLDELVFLPTGDAALTRRSRKYSTLSAVVLKFSKARGRYERKVCWSRKTHSHTLRRSVWPIARSGNDATNEHANAELNSTKSSSESLLKESGRYSRNLLRDGNKSSLHTPV